MKHLLTAVITTGLMLSLTANAQSLLETYPEQQARRSSEYSTLQQQNRSPLYTPRQNLGGEWVNRQGNRAPAYQPNYSRPRRNNFLNSPYAY